MRGNEIVAAAYSKERGMRKYIKGKTHIANRYFQSIKYKYDEIHFHYLRLEIGKKYRHVTESKENSKGAKQTITYLIKCC